MKFTRKTFINTLLTMIFGFRKPPLEQVTPVVTKVNPIKEPVMAKLAVPAYFSTSAAIFPPYVTTVHTYSSNEFRNNFSTIK